MAIRQNVAPLVNINDLAESYSPAGQFFVGDILVPRLQTTSSRFAYLIFDTIMQRVTGNIDRAPGGDVGRVTWDVTEATGLTIERAIESGIDRKTVTDFGRAIAEARAVKAVRDYLMIQSEARVVTLLQTAANFLTGYKVDLTANTDKWDDLENSDPEDDVRTGVDAIQKGAQITPNIMNIPYPVASKLAQHPAVRDVLIRDGRGSGSEALRLDGRAGLPAELWGLQVVVPKVSYVTSNVGATETNGYLWGNHVTLLYATGSPSVDTPSFAYNFTSHPQQFNLGNTNKAGGGEYVEGWEDCLEKIVGTKMGYFIENVIQ